MKNAVIAVLCFLSACAGGSEPQPVQTLHSAPAAPAAADDQQIFEATIARARRERLDTLPIGEVVARVGSWFVGAPYVPATLEAPGAESLVVNLREFDCVTYVESMLALARVIRSGQSSFADFKNQLRTIRYRSGKLGPYPTRLHYFSDWIVDNHSKGVVQDKTRELGGVVDPEPIDFMTQHRKYYRQLADSGFFHTVRAQEADLSKRARYMIPELQIDAVAARIKNGDVIAATSSVRGLDIAHTGLALWRGGQLHLMHAPLIGDSVEISENPLAERVVFIERQDGIMVARPREPRGN
ncbi:MAG TPA: N-acetylmuramoyl-L-alanine amidase-like domain-containing protein [Longimicrobiales bacterium]